MLDLTNTKVTDAGLARLLALKGLTALTVRLGGKDVSDSGLKTSRNSRI